MTFSLTVTGACEIPLTLDWGALDSLAHGADLVADTAALSPKVRGQGVKLGAVIDLARPLPAATHVMIHDGGDYRACLTLAEARDVAVLAHRLDGAPLPDASGGPARLLVPTSDNLCMSVKRVTRIELLTEAEPDTVPRATTPLRSR
ncbi:MAG: 2-dehydropantoate 2-reductase [bacterium]|nr:2-dehydropantoate 2-reductase [bacterium]